MFIMSVFLDTETYI